MTYKMSEDPVLQQLLKEERRWNMRARKLCMIKGHKWINKFGGAIICHRCSKYNGSWLYE